MAVFRLTAKGTLPGETFNFGLHVTGAAGSAAAAASDGAAAFADWWNDVTDGLGALVTADVSVVALHAAELDSVTLKQIDAAEESLALVGTSSGEMLPHECAVAVTTKGAAENRRDRGRFYLPPLSTSTVDGGRVGSATLAKLLNGAAIWFNELQAASYVPVILHPDGTTTAVSRLSVGDVFDVQRRRRNKLLEVRVSTSV